MCCLWVRCWNKVSIIYPFVDFFSITGGLLVGVLSGLLGFIYLRISKPAYNANGGMTPVVVMMCFLIGASMFNTIATVISSGVATTFVCLAEDPQALRRSKPELYEKVCTIFGICFQDCN